MDRCFYLHGYPDWHRLYGTKPDVAKMPKYNKFKQTSATPTGNSTVQGNAAATTLPSISTASEVPGHFTSDQYQHLLTLLNVGFPSMISPPASCSPDVAMTGKSFICTSYANHICLVRPCLLASDWIINIGATDHITTSFSSLTDPIAISAVIHLPNGKTSFITHKGTVHLSNGLVLLNLVCS